LQNEKKRFGSKGIKIFVSRKKLIVAEKPFIVRATAV